MEFPLSLKPLQGHMNNLLIFFFVTKVGSFPHLPHKKTWQQAQCEENMSQKSLVLNFCGQLRHCE
ncbi:hypothetical protein BTE48_17610 [Oceanospirillum multiglobuliferum]|uniref:Uncharacterized protein n=1 Tax=Oceanospirillum multiglobuliferum TaxID=64969 RepID=A0A1V4SZL9_9GAMM|nr:hypothetical protein BTE48_17610 [Oceanospirillum multiglobuliferum]